jgi:hypothetical protein
VIAMGMISMVIGMILSVDGGMATMIIGRFSKVASSADSKAYDLALCACLRALRTNPRFAIVF